jgi:hypothetical protein
MDDERLKNPPVGSSAVPDYFDEMLERIRDIRASERRVYLRVREIFACCSRFLPAGALPGLRDPGLSLGLCNSHSCAAWRLVIQSQLL